MCRKYVSKSCVLHSFERKHYLRTNFIAREDIIWVLVRVFTSTGFLILNAGYDRKLEAGAGEVDAEAVGVKARARELQRREGGDDVRAT